MVGAIVPKHLKEALMMLENGRYQIVAGGTDMLIQNHNRSPLPIAYKNDVMYIADIPELLGVTEDDEYIYIGACEPLEQLLHNPVIPKLLRDTILEMASPAIRNTGTLGGNIGNASPAGDSLVPLYLLNAVVEVQSVKETRRVNIKEFITGVRKIDLHSNELITRIIIGKIDFTKAYFKKVAPRRSDAISKIAFAGAVTVVDGLVIDLRFAFGAVNVTIVRHPEIECMYIKKTVEEVKNLVDEIILEYSEFIRPIDDQRSNKLYRKQVSINLLREFIEQI